jgi:hypothetical protein
LKVFSFRNIRILFLLAVLAIALIYTQEQKLSTTSWYKPVTVTVFPINGDGHPDTSTFIKTLDGEAFKDIDDFFARNSRDYDLIASEPIKTALGAEINEHPPQPPKGSGIFSAIMYSLKLRYWAYQHTPDAVSNQNRIRLFVLYHQPGQNKALPHSLGLQKGLIGVVHAFADNKAQSQNAVIMAHEILHTVGASDKYDQQLLPVYPQGYVEPHRQPLHPQPYAEIMAGRMAISADKAEIPSSLRAVKVGSTTAKEVNWIP